VVDVMPGIDQLADDGGTAISGCAGDPVQVWRAPSVKDHGPALVWNQGVGWFNQAGVRTVSVRTSLAPDNDRSAQSGLPRVCGRLQVLESERHRGVGVGVDVVLETSQVAVSDGAFAAGAHDAARTGDVDMRRLVLSDVHAQAWAGPVMDHTLFSIIRCTSFLWFARRARQVAAGSLAGVS